MPPNFLVFGNHCQDGTYGEVFSVNPILPDHGDNVNGEPLACPSCS